MRPKLVLSENYPWPGNVRELQNLIQRMVLMTDGPVNPTAAPAPEFKIYGSPIVIELDIVLAPLEHGRRVDI